MNARKCVHAQKPYPSQAFAHESSKARGRGKREEERQERQRPGGWWKERQPNKKKHIWGTKTRPTYAQLRLTKQGEERLTSPSHRMWPPAPIWSKIQYAKSKYFSTPSYVCVLTIIRCCNFPIICLTILRALTFFIEKIFIFCCSQIRVARFF